METINTDLERYYDSIDKSNECYECGTSIYSDKQYCSEQCYKASMI